MYGQFLKLLQQKKFKMSELYDQLLTPLLCTPQRPSPLLSAAQSAVASMTAPTAPITIACGAVVGWVAVCGCVGGVSLVGYTLTEQTYVFCVSLVTIDPLRSRVVEWWNARAWGYDSGSKLRNLLERFCFPLDSIFVIEKKYPGKSKINLSCEHWFVLLFVCCIFFFFKAVMLLP